MAPTFRHGRTTIVLGSGWDLSPILNDSNVAQAVDAAEYTAYSSPSVPQFDKNSLAGMRSGTASFSGLMDISTGTANLTSVLERWNGSTGKQVITWCPADGVAIGARVKMFQGIMTSQEVSSPADDLVSSSLEFECDKVRGGVWLRGSTTAVTSTGAQTAHTSAASTRGGVGHLHVLSASTLTSFVAKVQHSSNGSAWADLITFAAATGAGDTANAAQSVTVSGAVKAQVRANVTTFTGGAGKSVRYAVAFSRNR